MTENNLSTDLSTETSTENVNKYNNIIVNNTNEIYKSNNLIESSYRLTTAQNRLLYLGMTKLKKIILDKNMNIEQVEDAIQSSKFKEISIDVIEYKKKFNIRANNLYTELAKIANELQQQQILYFDDRDVLTSINWVITCKYDVENKSVGIQFHPNLIKDLLIFRNKYTRMIFDNFVNIKGKYSFRIYELCKQYLKIGYRDFFIEDLRFKLGIKDEEYKTYSDLKRQVLTPSLKELNKNTDLEIKLEETEKNRKTRKVLKIRFIIKAKENYLYPVFNENKKEKQLTFLEDEIAIGSYEEESIIQKLSSITGIDLTAGAAEAILTNALQAIDKHKIKMGVLDYIKEKIEICNKYSEHNIIKKPIGLLISALQKNWTKNMIVVNGEEIRINGMTFQELEDILVE